MIMITMILDSKYDDDDNGEHEYDYDYEFMDDEY